MARKKRSRYGDYCMVINGALYGSVNIPLGNGKYKRKRKRVENAIEARQWALAQLDKRSDRNERFTFYELGEWYKREFLVAPVYQSGKKVDGLRTYERQRTAVDRLSRYFGGYRLDSIDIDTVRRYKRERLKNVSITAVNRDLSLLRTMFNRACNRKWMQENPFQYSEKLIEVALESPARHPLTDRIAKRLLARSRKSEQPLLHYLILVMRHTGARPSEAFPYDAKPNDGIEREPLKWANILDFDFQAVRLVSYKSKIREERIVPTSEELERGLRKFYAEVSPKPNDLLFPFASVKTSWRTLCRSIRVRGVTLRMFRRYYNTKLVNSGLDEVSRMLILGHKEISTNRRYSVADAEFIRNYRQKMRR